MTGTLAEFNQLTDAEQYFEFFELPYDPQAVNVHRLHILKQFSNSIKAINAASPDATDEERLSQYKATLVEAYNLLLSSSGVEQKLFKVFNETPKGVVMLSQINSDS